MSDDGLEDLLGKHAENKWLSQCFLANRGKWGGRAAKLLNRTWRVTYDWHDSTQPLIRPPVSSQRVPRLGKALLEGSHGGGGALLSASGASTGRFLGKYICDCLLELGKLGLPGWGAASLCCHTSLLAGDVLLLGWMQGRYRYLPLLCVWPCGG